MSNPTETLEFQAEARQLLQLMVHSIYSNKDIFLRELISNASDALDKLRLESLVEQGPRRRHQRPAHRPSRSTGTQRTLTVRDNGIGMSRDEVVALIGTIAKSGTAELLRKLKESKDAGASQELIGQFGVGFYSTFMVADRVTLVTRRAGRDRGAPAGSPTGEGTYDDRGRRRRAAGHLGHPAPQAGGHRGQPLRLRRRVEDPRDRQAVLGLHRLADPDERGAPRRERRDDHRGPDAQLDEGALGPLARRGRPRTSTTSSTSTSATTGPTRSRSIHMKAEGTFEYEALLFIPSHAPCDLFMREGRRGVQLYVKRVFIMDDCDALMPDYLRFVKGVVDAHDLSLNISREILQQDRQIQHRPAPPGQEGPHHHQGHAGQGAAAVPHVLDRVRPGDQGGPARRRRQPGDAARPDLGRLHARPGGADHPARLRRAHEGRPERHLLRHRRVPFHDRELAAHGGVPRQGLRGAAADRPGRRGLGRAGRPVRRQAAAVDRQGPGRPGRRRRRGAGAGARAAAQGLRRPAEPARRAARRRGQGGAALLPPDHLAGLHRR